MSLRVVLHTDPADPSLEPVLLGQMLIDGFRRGRLGGLGAGPPGGGVGSTLVGPGSGRGPRPTPPGPGEPRPRVRSADRAAAVAASMFRACETLLRRRRVTSVTLRVRRDCVELTAVCLPGRSDADGVGQCANLCVCGDGVVVTDVGPEPDGPPPPDQPPTVHSRRGDIS